MHLGTMQCTFPQFKKCIAFDNFYGVKFAFGKPQKVLFVAGQLTPFYSGRKWLEKKNQKSDKFRLYTTQIAESIDDIGIFQQIKK